MTDTNGTGRREASTQHLRESRRHGFYMVYRSATRRIREHFADRPEGLSTATALAIYGAILELLNEQRVEDGPVHRRELAARAGVGLKAASRYQQALESAGVIRVERRVVEGVNLPNIVHVLDEQDYLERSVPQDPTPDERTPEVGSSGPDGSGREDTQLPEEATTTSSPEEDREEARAGARDLALVSAPGDVPRRPSPDVRYRGQVVPPPIVEGARYLLDAFNATTGRDLGAETAAGRPSPALTQIIGALLARPQVSVDEWLRAVQNTVAAPPRWVEGPVQIGTIFGERAAEHALTNTGQRSTANLSARERQREESQGVVEHYRRVAGVTA